MCKGRELTSALLASSNRLMGARVLVDRPTNRPINQPASPFRLKLCIWIINFRLYTKRNEARAQDTWILIRADLIIIIIIIAHWFCIYKSDVMPHFVGNAVTTTPPTSDTHNSEEPGHHTLNTYIHTHIYSWNSTICRPEQCLGKAPRQTLLANPRWQVACGAGALMN